MADANTPPVVTDFDVEWVDNTGLDLTEDQTHDHGYIHLSNGYTVSLLRSNVMYETLGFQDGKWEALIGRPAGPLAKLLGMDYEPAPELDHLLKDEVQGTKIAGNLDGAGINELDTAVAAAPAYDRQSA